MKAYILKKPDGTDADYSVCGECGQLATKGNFDISEKCCTCYDCGLPIPKEQRFARNTLYHPDCEMKRRHLREEEILEKAELVPDYSGPVYYEGLHGSFGDSYFADVDEFAESFESNAMKGEPLPEFVHCCKEMPFPGIDLDNILENMCEELYEDARDDLDGVEELQAAVLKFNEANKSKSTWNQDNKHKCAVPRSAV